MRSRWTWAGLLLAVPALLAGCGTDRPELQGTEIGCPWFEGAGNCWRASLAAATPCLPPSGAVGTLAADGKSCTFADSGHEVVFVEPLTLSQLEDFPWDLELRTGGDACLRFRQSDTQSFVLETSLGTFRIAGVVFAVQLTCPDGSQYKVSDGSLLKTCIDPERILPGVAVAYDESGVLFRFMGANGLLTVFDCRLP